MLPPNTRLKNGYIEFRKSYNGQSICRTWPAQHKVRALQEIYAILHKISRKEELTDQSEHRMSIDEAWATYLKVRGPSIKGGISESRTSQYQRLICQMNKVKIAWSGRLFDTITKYDVRDFLAQYPNIGTQMKYLGILTTIFKSFAQWNDEGDILSVKVKTPKYNPATKWRNEMKAHHKLELPRTRVLTHSEWNRFKVHLSTRTRLICEIALHRFLRLSDIRNISRSSINGQMIEGLQSKTGGRFTIPIMDDQPTHYDFTNFKREFKKAQVAANLEFPKSHPLHFTARDLRRTGATWAYRKTNNLVAISKLLGHTKITTTIRYLNIDNADMLSVTQALDRLVGENIGENWPTQKKVEERTSLDIESNLPG